MLLLSIPCIGPVTASYLIACTNAFTACSSGKQLACYCGVVPFEYQSGISIKGKHHVHKMANKNLKALLHFYVLSFFRYVSEFKHYFIIKKKNEKSKKYKHHIHKTYNKNLKALLHLCALSSIRYVAELKHYFNRKVKEGKQKMSIVNAIRNKLVLRAFSVIKNDKPYVEN